jgi:hypothetical protein
MASTSSTSGPEPFSLLSTIGDEVDRGEAVSSVGACTAAPIDPNSHARSSNYGPAAWWKENYDGFGFTDEQYQVLEAVTWGVAPKEIRRYYKRKNVKCGSASKKIDIHSEAPGVHV